MGIFLHFCIEYIFSFIKKKKKKYTKNVKGISVIYRKRTKCEASFLILNYFDYFVLSDHHVNIFVNFFLHIKTFFCYYFLNL